MKRSSVFPEIHIRFRVKLKIYLYNVLLKINELKNLFVTSANGRYKDEPSSRSVLCLQTDGNFTGAKETSKEIKIIHSAFLVGFSI
jgi:hypothetical protein